MLKFVMNPKKIVCFFITVSVNLKILNGEDSFITIPNFIRYPYSATEGPFIGIFLAISLPLELPEYNVFFSYNMEANYVLPQNETEYTYPPLLERSLNRRFWDRKYFYDILEFKIKSHGHPGKPCLLRAICEASVYSSQHTGILGDLLHILLTPSTSTDYVLEDYGRAEQWGRMRRNCNKYKKKCSTSFLDLVSQISHYVAN
ncbi:hypothetical protein Zmor_003377 [Zophobas morio]|uniref:Uncharacterized protein n=1 Tax=Zophobas morio TaxID=2755281 RepID=A0AA38M2L9_9CUCU|nr:hypothetical protein Zmor_003377 [Zophobas morio]